MEKNGTRLSITKLLRNFFPFSIFFFPFSLIRWLRRSR